MWFTDDPREFTRVEAEPGLTDDGDLGSLAQGGGWAGEEWVVVGAGARTGEHLDHDPLAWTSPDGLAWTPEPMPARAAEDAHRVLALDDGRLLAVGRSDDPSPPGSATTTAGSVDRLRRDRRGSWRGAPYVASLARTPAGVLATVSTGDHYELWQTDDGRDWREVVVPLDAGDGRRPHALAVAGGEALLLVADAGDGGRVWSGEPSD